MVRASRRRTRQFMTLTFPVSYPTRPPAPNSAGPKLLRHSISGAPNAQVPLAAAPTGTPLSPPSLLSSPSSSSPPREPNLPGTPSVFSMIFQDVEGLGDDDDFLDLVYSSFIDLPTAFTDYEDTGSSDTTDADAPDSRRGSEDWM